MNDIVINDDFGPLAELLDAAESSPDAQTLQQSETAILERIRAEVAAKSDGLRRGIVYYEKLAEDAKRVHQQAQARAQRIRAYVKAEMERAGVRRIDTPTGQLMVRGNGGVEPLVIFATEEIPKSFDDITVTMPLEVWDSILRYANLDPFEDTVNKNHTIRPSHQRIREELAKPCAKCGGLKTQCPSGPSDTPLEICSGCFGTGKQQVPGARLDPRGTCLVVK